MSAVPALSAVRFGGSPPQPLLVLGPSLGTSASTLWGVSGALLAGGFHVVGLDLPGHGVSAPATDAFSIAELAEGVLALVERVLAERGEPGGTFCYAGDSVAGAVGLQLLLAHPGRITAATLLCTGARIGTPENWAQRARQVRASGTSSMVEGSVERWFGPGFADREPEVAQALVQALCDTDRESYALTCEAIAGLDLRARLGEIRAPVLAVAGACDQPTPVASLRELADGIADARLVVLDGVAHLAPAEAPAEVARLITAHVAGTRTVERVRADGMAVRRAVLGDAHVDRATAAATDLTREFQDFITQYAWGSVWTRPGLDRRSRSMITLAALVARGHHEELAMHLRAARTNGLTDEEIKELLLQTAIYCGVPDANTAFRIASRVLTEPDES